MKILWDLAVHNVSIEWFMILLRNVTFRLELRLVLLGYEFDEDVVVQSVLEVLGPVTSWTWCDTRYSRIRED